MKVFYLNCARRVAKNGKLTQRGKKLVEIIKDNDIDFVFLSESSNYDLKNDLSDLYTISKVDEKLALGYGYNILAKKDFDISFFSFDSEESQKAKYREELHEDRIALINYGKICFIATHVPHEPKLRVIALKRLFDLIYDFRPLMFFGDFNCGYNEDCFSYRDDPANKKKPFIKEDEIFNLFEVLGYSNILKNEGIFTYEHKGKWADKFRIDHAFTNNPGRVKMEYIDMIEYGFNHKGMLIEVDD